MKRLSLVLCIFVLTAFASTSALADTFNFSFGSTGDNFSGSGVLTGTSLGSGQFLINGVTGTTTYTGFFGDTHSSTISGIYAPGTFPTGVLQSPNDNILYFPASYGLTDTYFDLNGLSYKLSDGTGVNLFFSNNQFIGKTFFGQSLGTESFQHITITNASQVPEPNSLALLGTGVLGLAGVIRRKFAA